MSRGAKASRLHLPVLGGLASWLCLGILALIVFPVSSNAQTSGGTTYAQTPSGYAATPSGYVATATTPGGYATTPGGYAPQTPQYPATPSAYQPPPGAYAATPSGYAATPSGSSSGYAATPSGYVAAPGAYGAPLPPLAGTAVPVQAPPTTGDVPTPYDLDDGGGARDKGSYSSNGTEIFDILVIGNQRIEAVTIINYMGIAIGDKIDQTRINSILKKLYATGLFSDVSIVLDDQILVAKVSENPVINQIAFEGNGDISDETLESEIQLRTRVVYTRSKVQSDTKRILEIYRRSGRFAAQVIPKIIELPENRVDLVFEIVEGDVTRVSRINFIGNNIFSDSALQGVILTQEKRWYRFFSTDDTYDPDRLAYDRELLRRYYLKNGYVDFRVVSAVAELTPNQSSFFITFTLDEGQRYKIGEVDVESRITELQNQDLMSDVETDPGNWYDSGEVEETINNLTQTAGDSGYAFVDVRTKINRDHEKKQIGIKYIINEGKRIYVEKINIIGNQRTLDKVVRREMRLVEGDAFNTAKLRRSRQLIRSLGIFEKVDINNVPGSSPDRTNITVEVAEKATGELSIGAGFSSTDGPLGNISIRERNLLGRNQDLKLSFQISSRSQEIDLSFTEPYFLDRKLAAGFDIFRVSKDYQDESGFDERSTGFSLRAGYDLIGDLFQLWNYTLRYDEISDVSSTASAFITERQKKTLTSSIGQTLSYDMRNDRVDPSAGYLLKLDTTYAGLGGDANYFRTVGTAGYWYPFAPQWVGSVRFKAANIVGVGESVAITERFFIGGEEIRGFATSGIGPRDKNTQDALGGNTYFLNKFELSFPTGLPKELGIGGLIFSDMGTLTGIDASGSSLVDTGNIRLSVGVGFSWKSPFGPIQATMAQALLKDPDDEVEIFRFSFGTRF
ncbi:MAG: outer membrane protein assembly factor BamA [Rhodospirillaceae bacterium]|nr:outer membrane protein assembly factor BamA [Rhodospirillaceae bacterium]